MPFVEGHVFVVLGLLVKHGAWGVTARPLLARLDVGKMDLPGIDPELRPAFRTKHELAGELLHWASTELSSRGKPLWVVADGACAKAPFLKPAIARGITVVSRLRKDAALWTVPGQLKGGHRDRPRIYGEQHVDLARRTGQCRGWSSDVFDLYGKSTVKCNKTFLATWRPVGGAIRVGLVDEPSGWRAFYCTETLASVADIPGTGIVAERFSLEITLRDCKEIVGACQQQMWFLWANIGSFHVCLWTFTLTEARAWGRKLVDR